MKFTTLAAILALMSGMSSTVYGQSNRGDIVSSTSVTTQKNSYKSGSNESNFIASWIKQQSPKYPPLLKIGNLSVSRTFASSGFMSIQSGPGGPPAPLPASGINGEKITIRNEFPGGAFEQWDYEWKRDQSGASWQLTGYQFRGPTSGGDIDEPTQPF